MIFTESMNGFCGFLPKLFARIQIDSPKGTWTSDPAYVIINFSNNTVSECFRKDTLSVPHSPPPHPKNDIRYLILSKSNIIKPHPIWNNNLSEPFIITLFRNISERYVFVTLLPPWPQKWWHSLSHKSNIIKPHPYGIILFWNVSEKYALVTLLLPSPLHPKMTLPIS